jgi:hypothetical protein
MFQKLLCFLAGVISGIAVCFAAASMLPDEEERPCLEDLWR